MGRHAHPAHKHNGTRTARDYTVTPQYHNSRSIAFNRCINFLYGICHEKWRCSYKKGNIGKPAFSAHTKNDNVSIQKQSESSSDCTHWSISIPHSSSGCNVWNLVSGGAGAGGRELASKKSIYQTNTSREQLENTWSGSPYLTYSPGIPSLNTASDMQLTNIKEGGFPTE